MDEAQKAFVDEVYNKRKLDSENLKQLLDYCLEHELVSFAEYERIFVITQTDNFKSKFWKEIRKVLIDSKHGFRIFNIFCRNVSKSGDQELKFVNVQKRVADNALKIGSVPEKPEWFVNRTSSYEELLRLLTQFNTVCVSGAIGMGKTSLVRCLVDDIQVFGEEFNYKIYWFDLRRKNKNDCLQIMLDFYQKILIHDDDLNLQNKFDPISIEIVQDHLLKIFYNQKSYKKALIVFDNVENLEIVEHFKKFCRVIIISDDKIEMENIAYIYINEGLTCDESIDVLRKALTPTTTNYENNFRQIHNMCKGDPATIGVWAKYLKDKVREFCGNPSVWIKKYKECVKNMANKLRLKRIKDWLNGIDDNIRIGIEKLAIFPKDARFTLDVLKTYLGEIIYEIEDILKRKNFLICTYDAVTNTTYYNFVYFFSDCLKNVLMDSRITSYHNELLEKYLNEYKYYKNFPKDNYIFENLGYHFKNANHLKGFDIYLDLDFIDAQIKATCYTAVLTDFKTYENEIIGNNDLKHHLNELKSLVEEAGPNITQSSTIVHYALSLTDNNPVYKDAQKKVQQNIKTLYLKYSEFHKNFIMTNTVRIEDHFQVALIISREDHLLLVGLSNGQIELRHHKNVVKKFDGHQNCIISLILNNKKTKLLSLASDGTAKLWRMPNVEEIKKNILKSGNICSVATFNGEISCAAICNKSKNIITGSKTGTVKIWRKYFCYTEGKFINTGKAIKFVTCLNSLIIITNRVETNTIYLYSSDNLELQKSIIMDGEIINLHVSHLIDIPETLLVIQSNKIVKLSWVVQRGFNTKFKFHDFTEICLYAGDNKFISSAIYMHYIILTDAENKIYRFDYSESSVRECSEINIKKNFKCMDLWMREENGNCIDILLSEFNDKSLRYYSLPISDKQETQGRQIYSCCWGDSSKGKNSPFIALVSVANTIKFMGRHNVIAETEPERSNVCAVHLRADMESAHYTIYYALEDGSIKSCQLKNKNSSLIKKLKGKICYFECIKDWLVVSTETTFFVYDINNLNQYEYNVTSSIMKAFLLAEGELLTIDKHKSTLRCYFINGECCTKKVLFDSDLSEPSCIELSLNRKLLCIAYTKCFNVFQFDNNEELTTKICYSDCVNENILCCAFSARNEILAIGAEDGLIYIFYFNENFGFVSRKKMKCYTSPVKALLFAPFGLILATLGDQFVLWNLKLLSSKRNSNSFQSLRNSNISTSNNFWNDKIGSASTPHLLASLKIDGLDTNRILVSPNFEKFLTVDTEGVIHTIEVQKHNINFSSY